MSDEAKKAFRLSRQQGIGGSDIGSLLSNHFPVEYGCERALWARLSGIAEDNPEVESEPMMLGTLLEPHVAAAYASVTGREVSEAPLKKHATENSLQVHVDRIIHPRVADTRTTDGVLEIKAVGREMMRKVQDDGGLPIDYVLQLNHGMLCHDLTWGAFAIGTREDLLPLVALSLAHQLEYVTTGEALPVPHRRARIVHFEMERSEEICRAIEEYGPKFWKTIGDHDNAPPRLEPEDPRCGRCTRKIWCQGAALMAGIEPEAHIPRRPDLIPLRDEYRMNMALLEQCEELISATERKFIAEMNGLNAVQLPVPTEKGDEWRKVIHRVRAGAARVDGRLLAIHYDFLRAAAIKADVVGAELVPPSSEFIRTGMPSRPLLLRGLLPSKPKAKGEVPEVDSE